MDRLGSGPDIAQVLVPPMNASAPSVAPPVPDAEPEFADERALPAPRSEAEELRIAAVVSQYFGLVWRALRRFGVSEGSADDTAQQVFLTFSRRLASVELGQERSFLLGVAVRTAANARRQRKRSREVLADGELEAPTESEHNPEQLLAQKQRRAELDRALAELPDEQRVVFVLYELEGFSLPEIAAALAIPLGTATSRLARGRARFEGWVLHHHAMRELP
ncbi:MAG: sigma-70 family RNA polymerase sigma factor [Polyangiaceae bacterium]